MDALTPITLQSPLLSLAVLPRGATVTALRLGPDAPNLLLGFADPADHFRNTACLGSVVGPVANRVTRGEVRIGAETHQMPVNEGGVTCLHSGPKGMHMLDWALLELTSTRMVLGLTLEDGAQGLPGKRRIEVSYGIAHRTLSVSFTARTNRATPMNIAWHPYWSLGNGQDVTQLTLQVAADHYLPVDALGLPTGEIRDVAGSLFDFREGAILPRSEKLDVNFCLTHKPRETPRMAARLSAPDGTAVTIESTAPGLQVYAGAYLPRMPAALSDGSDLDAFSGVAIEPQFWPDAPNRPEFPQITLHPGQVWRQLTHYHFTPPQ